MKSLISLTSRVLQECGTQDGVCTDRDLMTIRTRFEDEGDSFLTITLPTFAKGLEQSLEAGVCSPNLFPSFRFRGGLPVFLRGFLRLVFTENGVLLPNPSISAIRNIRQICLMLAKVELPSDEGRTRKAMLGYVRTDQDVGEFARTRDRSFDTRLSNLSAMLFGELLQELESSLYEGSLECFLPRHGPGATSDYLVGNQKFQQSEWPSRLDRVLPVGEFLLPNWRYLSELETVDILDPGAERPVRVVPVPKTVKTPRIIAIEPTCMQYAQQAVLQYLTRRIEEIPHLRHGIGLLDQTPNQRLALEGSILSNLATLDLSEASDRVSLDLVRVVFARFPQFLELLEATRSTKASVPVQDAPVELNKFASMGSALCFPVEAMCFYAISLLALENESGRHLRLRDVVRLSGRRVRVFGDDIIVPAHNALSVMGFLESFGLKVNRHKSFWKGNFRESCGSDFFKGENVNVVRLRRMFPHGRRDAEEVVSLVSFRNQLYLVGLWETCRWLDEIIREILHDFPVVRPTSPIVGRVSCFEPEAQAIHPDYQSPLARGYTVVARSPFNPLDGPGALLKCLLSSYEDSTHLERSGRPRAVHLKRGWYSVQ